MATGPGCNWICRQTGNTFNAARRPDCGIHVLMPLEATEGGELPHLERHALERLARCYAHHCQRVDARRAGHKGDLQLAAGCDADCSSDRAGPCAASCDCTAADILPCHKVAKSAPQTQRMLLKSAVSIIPRCHHCEFAAEAESGLTCRHRGCAGCPAGRHPSAAAGHWRPAPTVRLQAQPQSTALAD